MKRKRTRLKIVLAAVVLLGAAIAGGLVFYQTNKINPDEVFRKYLVGMASSNEFIAEEEYTATGDTTTLKGEFNANDKRVKIEGDIECSGRINDKQVSLKVRNLQDNETVYTQLLNAQGTLVLETGEELDLSTVFQNAVNKWYVLSEQDEQVAAQLNSGIYLFTSSVISPSYDIEKVVDELINSGAFTYTDYSYDDEVYNFSFVSDKTKMITAVKNVFPNLEQSDLIVDGLFAERSEIKSNVYVTKDGEYIKEELSNAGTCNELVEAFLGQKPSGIATTISGVNTVLESSPEFSTPSDTKPFELLFTEDLNL